MFGYLLLFVLVHIVGCEKENLDTTKLVGVDTVHGAVEINKDTIITRNLKLESKGKRKKADLSKDEGEPDWSYNAIPQEMNSYVIEFKRNMTECLKEVHASDSRPVKRLSPRTESPVHGECLIACVLKRNGVIRNGKVDKPNLLTLVNKFFAKETKLIKKLEKHLDSCIAMSVRHTDECDLAAKLNACTNDLMAQSKHKLTINY